MSEEARQMAFAGRGPVGFAAKRFHLQQLTERAATVVPGKNIYPVLANFQVTLSAGSIRVVATDMELSVISESSLVTCTGEGTVLLPAKRFLQILREVPEGDVAVQVERGTARITAGRVQFDLVLKPADDYPPLPDVAHMQFTQVNRLKLMSALSLVKAAAVRDGTNPKLMAVSISDGKVVAASQVRLHRASIEGFPLNIQIPVGAVDDLVRLLSSCSQETVGACDKGVLAFKIGNDVFMSGRMPGEYPDQESRLLGKSLSANKQQLKVDKSELAAAVRRVRITADDRTAAIGLRLSQGLLEVVSKDGNRNAAREEVPAEWESSERLLVVNHEHLLDLLDLSEGPQVTLLVGPDAGRRRSSVLLVDDKAGAAGVIGQLPPTLVE